MELEFTGNKELEKNRVVLERALERALWPTVTLMATEESTPISLKRLKLSDGD